jgi:hypothetical protein
VEGRVCPSISIGAAEREEPAFAFDNFSDDSARLQPPAQNFGNTPGLSDTPARRIRRLRVEDLADGTDASIVSMVNEAFQKMACVR